MLWWFVLIIPALLLSQGNLVWAYLSMGYPSRSFTWCHSDGTRTGAAGHAAVRVGIGVRCSPGGTGCARDAAGSPGTAGGVYRHSTRTARHGLSGRLPKPESAGPRPVRSSPSTDLKVGRGWAVYRCRGVGMPVACPTGG